MKPVLALVLALLLLGGSAAPAGEVAPGADLAQTLSQITGVAISPLLGVSVEGAWHYYHTPAERRGALPWFCSPYAWGTAFGLLALCFLKDLIGAAAPPLVKKPLDVAELFENKLSAIVACSAFLPFLFSQWAHHTPEAQLAPALLGPLASLPLAEGFDARYVMMPLGVIGFLVVWLACHAINVLIALCPFGFIDALLKLFKAALLLAVVASAAVSPFLGAAVSLVIILVAALVAPWAFRLTAFGAIFGLDILFRERGRRRAQPAEPHAFLVREIARTPVRTYGRLTRAADGAVAFSYRPWLILPRRSLAIPAGDTAVAKGVLFPSLLHRAGESERHGILLMFLPRYRSHEHSIASHFGIGEVVESPLARGFRAVRTWMSEMVNLGRPKTALPGTGEY